MAENEQTGGNNLDDFFAKKDKSKKKTKSSKFTVDDILQAKADSEEKSKKVRPSKKKEKDANRSDKMLGVKAEEVIFCFSPMGKTTVSEQHLYSLNIVSWQGSILEHHNTKAHLLIHAVFR